MGATTQTTDEPCQNGEHFPIATDAPPQSRSTYCAECGLHPDEGFKNCNICGGTYRGNKVTKFLGISERRLYICNSCLMFGVKTDADHVSSRNAPNG